MKVIVDNLAVEYEDSGNGPIILMLHGWQDSMDTFNALENKLVQSFRVIKLDLPGFGKSDIPKETWDLKKYSKFVSSFIRKLNIPVYCLIGHSFGGRIIIKSLSQKIIETEKAVLIASAGISGDKTLKNSIIRICSKILGPLLRIPPLNLFRDRIRYKFYSKIGSDYVDAGVLQKTFVKVISEDLLNESLNIDVPVMLIYGDKDQSTPVEYGEKFTKNISNSEFFVIKDAGHFLHQENSDEVFELINNFVNN